MRHKTVWFLSWVFVLGMAGLARADDPTSRFLLLSPLASSLPASGTGLTVQFEVWDAATAGTMIFAEAHTVDTDEGSNIKNDTGLADLLLGRGTVGGLLPANFPAGSTRYLDVTQGGVSVLAARLPLYASVFSIAAPNEVPGNLALVNSTATAGNILKDGFLFLHNFGTANTFVGSNAGNLTMTGGVNTASGVNALRSNTTGAANTASGVGALQNNTTGDSNTASGINALFSNTTGSRNTASGAGALQNNTTGVNNTASGFQALLNNTTGLNNTATGVSALVFNTTGSRNTASGFEALKSNTTGSDNAASGYQALLNNTTGLNNTASGLQALLNNTTGGQNTASGVGALSRNTTGSGNTAIGVDADVAFGMGNLTNATAIGAGAIVNASNKIRLGDTFVTVVEGPPYSTVSDRNQKENFQAVDGEQVLRKVGGLNVTSWNYIGHDPKQFRHYGPVAQEFFGAFGHDAVGTIGTDTTINSGDMEGILMIAVQTLEKRTAELGQEKQRLTETVEALKAEVKAQGQHREIEQREQAAKIAELEAQLTVGSHGTVFVPWAF